MCSIFISKNKTFRIEQLSPSNLMDVAALFLASFDSVASIASIQHKHMYCHGKVKYVGFLAYESESGEPAAFYAVFPFYMVVNGKQVLSAQSGDTMTHPKYQKQGLFVWLAEFTFNFCRNNNISLIIGMPNSTLR